MDAYTSYMAESIAEEIKAIEDPYILNIYLTAILYQRCRIGGAQKDSCKGCMYQSYYCRQLNEVNQYELQMFDKGDNANDKTRHT